MSVAFGFDFDGEVTDSCASNLRATLERTIESLQANPETTFEQYLDS